MTTETKELITKVFIFIYPIVLVIGAIGNLFSFIIFSREKFRKTSFSLYFRVLAFSDTFTLLFTINDFSLGLYNQDLSNSSYFMCKCLLYIAYSLPPVSIWLLVVVSLDRMLSIIKPSKFLFLKKTKTQATICFLIISYSLTYYIPVILYRDYEIQRNLSENSSEFVYQCIDREEARIVDWMDVFNSTIFPFLLMSTSTYVTVSRLFKSRSKTMIKSKNSSSSFKHNHRDVRFAVTSAFLNGFFILCTLPFCGAYYLTAKFAELDEIDLNLFYFSTLLFYYINFGVVFYVNFFTNPLFRNELFVFLRFRKATGLNES